MWVSGGASYCFVHFVTPDRGRRVVGGLYYNSAQVKQELIVSCSGVSDSSSHSLFLLFPLCNLINCPVGGGKDAETAK